MRNLFYPLLIITLIGLPILLESCDKPNISKESTGFRYGKGGIEVVIYHIDDHEYLGKLTGTNSDWATHSGECPNPIHKTKIDTVYLVAKGIDTLKTSK